MAAFSREQQDVVMARQHDHGSQFVALDSQESSPRLMSGKAAPLKCLYMQRSSESKQQSLKRRTVERSTGQKLKTNRKSK